jgi:hypothetical protein
MYVVNNSYAWHATVRCGRVLFSYDARKGKSVMCGSMRLHNRATVKCVDSDEFDVLLTVHRDISVQ